MSSAEEPERLTIAGGEIIDAVPSNVKQAGVLAFKNFDDIDNAPDDLLPDEPEPLTESLKNDRVFDMEFSFHTIDYNFDDEDARYVHKFNKNTTGNHVKLTRDLLQQILDRFEKLAVFEFYRTGQMVLHAKKPVITSRCCDICGSAQDTRNNKIVTCQYCYVSVHQECYGTLYLPIGKWSCRRCGVHPTVPVKCVLCPFEGGAMKFTTRNSAVHQLCAIWTNGVTMGVTSAMEPVEIKTTNLNKHRCDLCGITYGAVQRCAFQDCDENYHITCAALARVIMEVEMNHPEGPRFIRRIFCFQHSSIPTYEAQKRIHKVKLYTKLDSNGKRYCPIDIRARPISAKYLTPEYINPDVSSEDIDILYEYWLVKRLKNFGTPITNRMKAIYDRLAEPSRALKYETIKPVNRAARMRVDIVATGAGKIKIVGDFSARVPEYQDRPVQYVQNVFSDDPDDCFVDIENKAVVEREKRLIVDELIVEGLGQKLMTCDHPKKSTKLIAEIVQQQIDPKMSLDFAPYDYADKITPWDILGIMFLVCCPVSLQAIAFLNALRYLDEYGMFLHFNCNSPNHVNISTMCQKALSPGYLTWESLLQDVNRMLIPINSPFVKNQRLSYAKRFEESICYMLLPRPYGRVINLMMDNLKIRGDKNKIVLHHLLHQLTDFENRDPILKTLSVDDRHQLQAIINYVRHVIMHEKGTCMPSLEMTADLFRRRRMESLNEKLIISPECGFSVMPSERVFAIREVVFKPRFNFARVSWHQRFASLEIDSVQKNNALHSIQAKIFQLDQIKTKMEQKMILRKRKNGDRQNEPPAKKKRGNHVQTSKITQFITKDPQPPGSPEKSKSPSKQNKKVPLALFCPDTGRFRDIKNVKYFHDTIVITSACSVGEHFTGTVIDPRNIQTKTPDQYESVMALPHAGWRHYSCLRLFLADDKFLTEWVANAHIKIVNMVKLCRYIEGRDKELDDTPAIRSLKAAVVYFRRKNHSAHKR